MQNDFSHQPPSYITVQLRTKQLNIKTLEEAMHCGNFEASLTNNKCKI